MAQSETPPTGRRPALIVRAWCDEQGSCWGQVVDPVNEWRAPFGSAAELWRVLTARLGVVESADQNTQGEG
jgi:hypothetical protein